jgi:hypothetical protein
MRYPTALLLIGLGLLAGAGPAAAQVVARYGGMCEASAAVPLAGGSHFVVANDDDNSLRIYRAAGGGPVEPVPAPLVLEAGAPPRAARPGRKAEKADIEGAARIGERIYWIGSHGRDSKGEREERRLRFFATEIAGDPRTSLTMVPVGRTANLLEGLRGALAKLGIPDPIGPVEEGSKVPALGSESGGLNIEGLAAWPPGGGSSLLIALRGPLRGREAVLVPFENPAAVVDRGEAPRFGDAFTLDLDGRGVRDMVHSPERHAAGHPGYVIAAGPVGSAEAGGPGFEILTWTGRPRDKPQPVPEASDAIRREQRFHPEALLVEQHGRAVRLLSDDGDGRPKRPAKCDKLPRGDRDFRAILLPLPPR